MKQVLFILLAFAQQTICSDNTAAQAQKSHTKTPKHSPQKSISNQTSSESNQPDTNGLSDKVKELLAQAGTLIFRSTTANADNKDETES